MVENYEIHIQVEEIVSLYHSSKVLIFVLGVSVKLVLSTLMHSQCFTPLILLCTINNLTFHFQALHVSWQPVYSGAQRSRGAYMCPIRQVWLYLEMRYFYTCVILVVENGWTSSSISPAITVLLPSRANLRNFFGICLQSIWT